MTTASEHAQILLSALIPDRRDLFDRALQHLTPDHFPDQTLRNMFVMLERYSEVTGAIITRDAIGDLLNRAGADPGKIALYQETFDLLESTQADEAAFRWSLEQLRELAAERSTGEALTQAMEILIRGAPGERGQILRGHREARSHVLQRFAEIDRGLSMQEAPEGDIRNEADDILADYATGAADRLAGRSTGVMFGIPALDNRTNGLGNGDLVLTVAYTGEGKTHLAVQLAWNASVMQGKNVVFVTTETIRSTVRRRLISRHSCQPHFEIPGGINSSDIKNFSLDADEREKFYQVVTDLSKNSSYGRCWIAQAPRSATMGWVESKLMRLQRMFHIDLVIIDSLYLLRPEKRRNTDREELSSILKEAKQLSTTFNDGYGVPIISPWQVSRAAREQAERTGFYTPSALSETAEASNSADIIISLLAPLDNDKRIALLKMQAMKNRDGERDNSIEIELDYATSKFAEKSRNDSMDSLLAL